MAIKILLSVGVAFLLFAVYHVFPKTMTHPYLNVTVNYSKPNLALVSFLGASVLFFAAWLIST